MIWFLTIVACAVAGFAQGESLDMTSNEVAEVGYTVRLSVDLSDARADESLYAIPGALALRIRLAGRDDRTMIGKMSLMAYDRHVANYLNFPMPDGSCPVLEAEIPGDAGRIGIPLGFLPRKGGVHEVVLNYGGWHWTIAVDGFCDDDMPIRPPAWPKAAEPRVLSSRVRSSSVVSPACSGYYSHFPSKPHPIAESIQYWTPRDHNAWVGDVVVGSYKGKLHLFYLYDRRHHRSKSGQGGHYFGHLATADLVNWDEYPFATTVDDWWETHGTGTPFAYRGKFCLAYGLHTQRMVPDNRNRYPEGGYWAVSDDDGVTFRKVGYRFTHDQNPTMANLADGILAMFGARGDTFVSPTADIFDLRLVDDGKARYVRGDCPCQFEWNGWHYRFQGFCHFDASPTGAIGSYEDWMKSGDDPYDGLSVPMVVPFGDNRRIIAGWIRHPSGWGGYLCLRELVQFADGKLGSKWLPEAPLRGTLIAQTVRPDRKWAIRFKPVGGVAPRNDLILEIDPHVRRAQFTYTDKAGAVVPQLTLSESVLAHPEVKRLADLPGRPDAVRHYAVGKLRNVDRPFEVRLSTWYDAKGDVTIFNAEIAGVRTMTSVQRGRFAQ